MEWVRAVLWENEKQMDETFLGIWVEDGRGGQKYVRWPPKNEEADALAKR